MTGLLILVGIVVLYVVVGQLVATISAPLDRRFDAGVASLFRKIADSYRSSSAPVRNVPTPSSANARNQTVSASVARPLPPPPPSPTVQPPQPCPQCGGNSGQAARFCRECGASLSEHTAANVTAPQTAALGADSATWQSVPVPPSPVTKASRS